MEEQKDMEEPRRHSYEYPLPSVTIDCVMFGFDGTKLKVLHCRP